MRTNLGSGQFEVKYNEADYCYNDPGICFFQRIVCIRCPCSAIGDPPAMSNLLNPYIAGAPVTETSMFFGREDVFRWIENSLSG
jgi:hypothetical protein